MPYASSKIWGLRARVGLVLTDEGKPKVGLKAPAVGGAQEQVSQAAQGPSDSHCHLLTQPGLAAPSTSPILTRGVLCPVLLGTFPEPEEPGFPAAQKLHAQGCARPPLSQSRSRAASLSPAAAAGASHYGQRAGLGRASIVRQGPGLRGAGRGVERTKGPREGGM